jgi:RimJ/RimL family protein N-acetyltransferase
VAAFGPEEFALRSGASVVFRHCEARDVDTFLEFRARIASETTHTMQIVGQATDHRDKTVAAWESMLRDDLSLRLGVFDGDRMVAGLGFHPEHGGNHPWARHVGDFGMMVLQEFWGQGLGRRMLEIIEDHAQACGITRIEARVRAENERGVKLYQGMGYRIEGTRVRAVRIDGRYQDEYFIAKLLDGAGNA